MAGDSSFSWYLVNELKDEVTGRLYFVLEDKEQAIEASLLENVIAITGDITDTKSWTSWTWQSATPSSWVPRKSAPTSWPPYMPKKKRPHVYARVFEEKVSNLLESLGVTPIITAATAASFSAVDISSHRCRASST